MLVACSYFKYSMLQSCQFTTLCGPKETNNAQSSNLCNSVLFKNCLHGEAFCLKGKWSGNSLPCCRCMYLSSGFSSIYLVLFSLCLANNIVEA